MRGETRDLVSFLASSSRAALVEALATSPPSTRAAILASLDRIDADGPVSAERIVEVIRNTPREDDPGASIRAIGALDREHAGAVLALLIATPAESIDLPRDQLNESIVIALERSETRHDAVIAFVRLLAHDPGTPQQRVRAPAIAAMARARLCLLYTSPSPRDPE